ncbi:unnamed protein product [Gongylonema pulchrum]|uniref:PA2c domain-containing protein n=1 Tax=Gongylonema pulchrum TaxID=637853 RepID=A0A183EZ10_9BILA|nr:unnamed protein product [Gongylonema pulchrum]
MFSRALLLSCLVVSSYAAFWNLFGMGRCSLTRSLFEYNGYGCNCGLGRKNQIPVDDVDRCCLRHSACYEGALESGDCNHWFSPYFTSYSWKCENKTALCQSLFQPIRTKSFIGLLELISFSSSGQWHSYYFSKPR